MLITLLFSDLINQQQILSFFHSEHNEKLNHRALSDHVRVCLHAYPTPRTLVATLLSHLYCFLEEADKGHIVFRC